MKKFNLLMLIGALTLGGVSLSSCGFIGSDPYSIENVTSTLNSDGSTTVKIEFTSEAEVPDYEFVIPKGQDGKGIKDVKATPNEENTLMNIVITFSDDTTYEISLPIVHGKDGNGIKSIVEGINEETQEKTIIITYTDETKEPTVITLPKGETGNGIASITYEEDPLTGTLTLVITYTNGDTFEVPIPKPNGIKGVFVSLDSETGDSIITFTLTDGTVLDPITLPRATRWYQGSEAPNINLGFPGDFFFNIKDLIIYTKTKTGWEIVINFKNTIEQESFTVEFYLNANGDPNASFNGYKDSFTIAAGKNFYYHNISLPLPKRTGYIFDGWYTEAIYNVTLGRFDNFTNVYSNMKLFANWISE